MYHYCAFNFRISSEVPLSAFSPATSGGDVILRIGQRHPRAGPPRGMAWSCRITQQLATLDYANIGTLTIREGREIVATLLPDANETALLPYLTADALAVLCYQRGLQVLRAPAVCIARVAIAFMFENSAVTAALASLLHQRGHVLLADSIAVIELRQQGPVILPAFPNRLLASDAAQAAAPRSSTPVLSPPATQHRLIPGDPDYMPQPVPLRNLYKLADGSEPRVSRISMQRGLYELISYSYPSCMLQPSGEAHLRQWARLMSEVSAYQTMHSHQAESLTGLVDMIETHSLETIYASSALGQAGKRPR